MPDSSLIRERRIGFIGGIRPAPLILALAAGNPALRAECGERKKDTSFAQRTALHRGTRTAYAYRWQHRYQLFPEDGKDAEALSKNADTAMYQRELAATIFSSSRVT